MASSLSSGTHSSEQLLAQVESLPALGGAGAALVGGPGGWDANRKAIYASIDSDPVLQGHVLEAGIRASSGRNISSVAEAATVLGTDGLGTAILVLSAQAALGSGAKDAVFDCAEFWKHCLGVGFAAKLLSEALGWRVDADLALACGVYHDIGKAAMATVAPKSYDRVVRQATSSFGEICATEQQVLGLDHTIAGRRLARVLGVFGNR